MIRSVFRSRRVVPLVALLALVFAATAAPASAQSLLGGDDGEIRPGAEMLTDGAQCTGNFIFTDGEAMYIGYAAHCAGTGGATNTNGCETASLDYGTEVQIENADEPGTLAYSSWKEMRDVGETDENACSFNDFALVEIDPADHDKINPAVPGFGGPTDLGAETSSGDRVFSYGNSSLRAGLDLLKPKEGLSLGQSGGGWTHSVYTVTPGIPGDSGSGFLTEDGTAFGVLSTLALAPLPASNGVSDLGMIIDYANDDAEFDVDFTLVEDEGDFSPSLLSALL